MEQATVLLAERMKTMDETAEVLKKLSRKGIQSARSLGWDDANASDDLASSLFTSFAFIFAKVDGIRDEQVESKIRIANLQQKLGAAVEGYEGAK